LAIPYPVKDSHLLFLSFAWRTPSRVNMRRTRIEHLPPTFDPREEPGALAAHAGICAGGEEQSSSLPRP